MWLSLLIYKSTCLIYQNYILSINVLNGFKCLLICPNYNRLPFHCLAHSHLASKLNEIDNILYYLLNDYVYL